MFVVGSGLGWAGEKKIILCLVRRRGSRGRGNNPLLGHCILCLYFVRVDSVSSPQSVDLFFDMILLEEEPKPSSSPLRTDLVNDTPAHPFITELFHRGGG
jgi:hypothetical protein